jgi:hypothetical protein
MPAFNEGDHVRLVTPVIEGAVADITFDKASNSLAYLINYTDADGHEQSRWFAEAQLTAAPAPSQPAA